MAFKDIHYDGVGWAAIKAYIPKEEAIKIAWSSAHTDFHDDGKFRTAIHIDWNIIKDAEAINQDTQANVIIPFHALPCGHGDNPWIVEADSHLANHLIIEAIRLRDPFGIGVALHSYVDSFFHQSFTGWREAINHNDQLDIRRAVPAILHAEYGTDPDELHIEWKRNGVRIDNKQRALDALTGVYQYCLLIQGFDISYPKQEMKDMLAEMLEIDDYNERKKWFRDRSGLPTYTEAHEMMKPHIPEFKIAAKKQLSIVTDWTKGL